MKRKKERERGKSLKKPAPRQAVRFDLRLYIADSEINSRKAVELVRKFYDRYLKENFSLEIVDVFQDYQSALRDRVLVAPTLVWMRKDTPAFLMGSFEWSDLLEFFGLSDAAGGEK